MPEVLGSLGFVWPSARSIIPYCEGLGATWFSSQGAIGDIDLLWIRTLGPKQHRPSEEVQGICFVTHKKQLRCTKQKKGFNRIPNVSEAQKKTLLLNPWFQYIYISSIIRNILKNSCSHTTIGLLRRPSGWDAVTWPVSDRKHFAKVGRARCRLKTIGHEQTHKKTIGFDNRG